MAEYNMQNPFIIGKHLYLRPLEPDQDASQLAKWYNDQDLRRYLLTPHLLNRARYRDFIDGLYKSFKLITFGIASKNDNVLVGLVGLKDIDHIYQTAELYVIKIDPESKGKVMALRAHIHYGFMELNLNRIQTLNVVENIPGWKIEEKLGFQLEGIKCEAFFRNGQYYDICIYSLTSPVYTDLREFLFL